MKKVSIIVLSFNTIDLLAETLESVGNDPLWEIVVVDNGSTDGSLEMVQKKFTKVKLIHNRENKGFAAACNQGIRATESEYVMLLNSDVLVEKGVIAKMVGYLAEHDEAGVITPKVVLPNGKVDLACHRGMPTPWNALCYFLGLEKLWPTSKLFSGYHQLYKGLESIHQVGATSATAMLVKREVIENVGLLDEQFFFYAEDLDWCKRIAEAGYQIMYYPLAQVTHLKSQSGKANNTNKESQRQSQLYFYETMKQFYRKHYQNIYPAWMQKIVFLGIDFKKWKAMR